MTPVNIGMLVIAPLRYFFSTYTRSANMYWDPDEKKRTVEIDSINNLHKIPYQERPRILVDRGPYSVPKTSLTDSMANQKVFSETGGIVDRNNFIMYSGEARIIIEADQEGACELLVDMCSHFLVWSRPLLCNSQMFKDFGLPMNVSTCELGKEDKPKFTATISFPYMIEELWNVTTDAISIKDIVQTYIPESLAPPVTPPGNITV